jgi:hypothetical protein
MRHRATRFHYLELEVRSNALRGHYELDGRRFVEEVDFEGELDLRSPGVRALCELWFLLAGLSYYKAGAAHIVDLGTTPVGDKGRALLHAAIVDGLGEYAYKNDIDLTDVEIVGGTKPTPLVIATDLQRVLVPFGGGIDSVVTVEKLAAQLEKTLFIVSPSAGRFAPLEDTARVTGLNIVRATRSLDRQILSGEDSFYNGHVPVTAMITLLAAVAALASGRGGVVMSNEHSSSAPNLRWHDRDVNHQWSKSWIGEQLIADAVAERIGDKFTIASYLRDRSEIWVALEFSKLTAYHHVFRSCNRAFAQRVDERALQWCGECDKCLFIALVLAPFLSRDALKEILGSEPLASFERRRQLEILVGLGNERKPFECVGDPEESAVALRELTTRDEWRDEKNVAELGGLVAPDETLQDLLRSRGVSRVPAHWL